MTQQFTLPSFPLSSFLALAEACADYHGTALLYSGGSLDSAERSFLALFPFECATLNGHVLAYQKGGMKLHSEVQDPWKGLQHHFFDHLEGTASSMAFGWLGYGMGAFVDTDVPLPYRSSTLPDAYWQRCAIVIRYDHKLGQALVTVEVAAKEYADEKSAHWINSLTSREKCEHFFKQFSLLPRTVKVPPRPLPLSSDPQRRAHYLDSVSAVQDMIREGEVYQVNLSQQFQFQSHRHPFSLYREVCETNPAPFSAYIRYGKTAIVSSSPERFLCKRAGVLEARPIKGTIQRGRTEAEDLALKEALLSSPKERSELLMITDLMRNDLGKISVAGSVETIDLWRCEAYANVFHLIAVVRSIAKEGLRPLEIVRACFPGGSITGCPKLRAMEIIDALEKRPRGIYTGSIGYFTGSGDFDLNIAIRTLVAEGNFFSLQLGGGIVIDSDPEQEYRETIHKGGSFFQLLQGEPVTQSQH